MGKGWVGAGLPETAEVLHCAGESTGQYLDGPGRMGESGGGLSEVGHGL